MKRLFFLIGALISCMFFAAPVQADVIFEPEDSFYQAHAADCEYVERQFTANGPEGKVIVYESPESPKVVDTWENGHKADISHTYEDRDGILWGVGRNGGWMPMEYMEVVYDNISFMEEHAAEIQGQSGVLDGKVGEAFYFWKYPGSEVAYKASIEENPPSYEQVYTDSQGRQWAYVVYYYGDKDVWICIDQPAADYGQLYPQGAAQETVQDGAEAKEPAGNPADSSQDTKAQQSEGRIQPKRENGTILLAAALVGAVVLVTALLFVWMKKKGKG